jgi:hypothetical protein
LPAAYRSRTSGLQREGQSGRWRCFPSMIVDVIEWSAHSLRFGSGMCLPSLIYMITVHQLIESLLHMSVHCLLIIVTTKTNLSTIVMDHPLLTTCSIQEVLHIGAHYAHHD